MRTSQQQCFFPTMDPLEEALEGLKAGGAEERGALFTRRGGVEFILDLVGYTNDAPLPSMRLLEPSFGGGDFLLAAIDRLVRAYIRRGNGLSGVVNDLKDTLRGVELHRASFEESRARAVALFGEI